MSTSILYLQLPGAAHPGFSNIPTYGPHHPEESGSSVEEEMFVNLTSKLVTNTK